MSDSKPRRPRKPRFRQWKGIPRDMVCIARDRTAYLAEPHPLSVQPFRTALANAYMQGIADAAESIEGNSTRPGGRT